MPRDPFFRTRADEISANTVAATLAEVPGVFVDVVRCPNGTVLARTRTTEFLLDWDVTHQRIRTLAQVNIADHVQVHVLGEAA